MLEARIEGRWFIGRKSGRRFTLIHKCPTISTDSFLPLLVVLTQLLRFNHLPGPPEQDICCSCLHSIYTSGKKIQPFLLGNCPYPIYYYVYQSHNNWFKNDQTHLRPLRVCPGNLLELWKQRSSFFFFFLLHYVTCGGMAYGILVPWPEIKPGPLAMRRSGNSPKDSFIEVARLEECKPFATNSPFREKWEWETVKMEWERKLRWHHWAPRSSHT